MKVASSHKETENFYSGFSKNHERYAGQDLLSHLSDKETYLGKAKRPVHGILANVVWE